MKLKTLLLISIVILLTNRSYAQDQAKYAEFVKEASQLYESKDFKKSAKKYKAAFDELDGKAYSSDRYNAACSYALSGDPENAFYHLRYLAENPNIKYRNLSHISSDKDLNSLHSDERWSKLLEAVKANKNEYEKVLDMPLVKQLDSIFHLDQNYRRQISATVETYGNDSKEMRDHWKKIQEIDSINLIAIKKILDERGWLGSNVIGDQGNQTLFLVIQHADLEAQLKYLPMMREAVNLGNARAGNLALLEDRVALRQGKRQIYGSQISKNMETNEYYVSPLIEPEKVNERRAEVGLGPIESYVFNWGITWDLEKHKERTKKLESDKKE